MNRTSEIQIFLKGSNNELGILYNPYMECQVNVNPGGGKAISGLYHGHQWKGFTKGEETWKAFRIPWNSSGVSQFEDSPLGFNLADHIEAIGLTGWKFIVEKDSPNYDGEYKGGESIYLGYDIDSVVGHKKGLTEEELIKVEAACAPIPWISLIRSRSGRGIHLYLHLEKPVKTEDHHVHAALCRSMLSVLTIKTGIDFQAPNAVDCIGMILWIWHVETEKNGLQYIKKATELFPSDLIPKNWRDHVEVTSGRARKVRPIDPIIEELYSSTNENLLNKEHKKLLVWGDKNAKYNFYWEVDWHALICSTLDLKQAYKDCNFVGLFDTNSTGSSEQNCYCYPLIDGGWVVRRFGNNVTEHRSWLPDERGLTRCFFNSKPKFNQSMLFFGGKENTKGEFVFDNIEQLNSAMVAYDINYSVLNLPNREMNIKSKEDRIILKMPIGKGEIIKNEKLNTDFLRETTNYTKVIKGKLMIKQNEISTPDEYIRATISSAGDTPVFSGWYVLIDGDFWVSHPDKNVSLIINNFYPNLKSNETRQMLGEALLRPWKKISRPFEPIYNKNREWNLGAAQFSCEPVQGAYPNWKRVLDHCGEGLNIAVSEDSWCQVNGLSSGADYLFHWISSMFQFPTKPLPYLFFHSIEQNTGKSTLHECLKYFFKGGKGYVLANNSLNSDAFNGELASGVLAVCDEVDLRKSGAYAKIKLWVTGETLSIRDMYTTSYEVINTLHFMQFANDVLFCPQEPGDRRIVSIKVNPLTHVNTHGDIIDDEIPRDIFYKSLKEEIPFFLYDLLKLNMPRPYGRLTLPVLKTEDQLVLNDINIGLVNRFLRDCCHVTNGRSMPFREFYQSFKIWLENHSSEKDKKLWTENFTLLKFPTNEEQPLGRSGAKNEKTIGNISFDSSEKPINERMFVKHSNRIKLIKLEKENV